MSTVAYRDGILAADTQGTWDDQPHVLQLKIFRTERFLIGFSGRFFNAMPVLKWVKDQPEDRHPMDFWQAEDAPRIVQEDVMSAHLIDRAGDKFILNDTGHCNRIATHREYDAMGSGGDYACGAMAAGATAIEAIQYAQELDIHSGGPVAYVTFDHPITDHRLGLTGEVEGRKQITVVG